MSAFPSMFACQSAYSGPKTRKCALEGVSTCGDFVSHLICNKHSELFGLTHKLASYYTDSGESWTKINLYASSQNSLSIPLFIDKNSKVLMNEIKTFVTTTCNRFANINVDVLQNRLADLLGINMYGNYTDCNQHWLSDPNTAIILYSRNSEAQVLFNLPQLHKILFFYANSSTIENRSTNTSIYMVPNLSLTYNNSSDACYFVVPNKDCLLKYTSDVNCVATPIVLDAKRAISRTVDDVSLKPLTLPMTMC